MHKHRKKLILLFLIFFSMLTLIAALPFCIVRLTARTPVPAAEPAPAAPSEAPKPVYDYTISVYLTGSRKTVTVDLEEYVKCVTASEMPAAFELEALKAQAVAARTYAVSKQQAFAQGGSKAHPQAALCDDVHCQVYRDRETIRSLKSPEWMQTYWGKLEEAARQTSGEVMTYQGRLVDQPLFYSSSGGQTENSEDVFSAAVPYLRSVLSPYEEESPHQSDTKEMTLKELERAVKKAGYGSTGGLKKGNIEILSRNEGGSVAQIKLGRLTLRGRDVRAACALRSANFDLAVNAGKAVFTTKGYGHGVGMSQYLVRPTFLRTVKSLFFNDEPLPAAETTGIGASSFHSPVSSQQRVRGMKPQAIKAPTE